MGESVDVSVVIVNWNTRELLRECVASVYQTTRRARLEVFVVDNASSDGSAEMVQEEFPSCEVVQLPANVGFAKANNVAIRRAHGRFVCLINSDVIVQDGCIDRMLVHMDSQAGIGILGPRVLNPDGTLQPSCRGALSLWNATCRALAVDRAFPRARLLSGLQMTYCDHATRREVDTLLGCFWMVRRDVFERVGLLDECFFMYAEDFDLCERVRRAGWTIVYFPDASAMHHGGGSSVGAPRRSYLAATQSSFLYWRKRHRRPARALISGVVLLGELLRMARGGVLWLRQSRRKEATEKVRRSRDCVEWLLGRGAVRGDPSP